MAGMLAHSAEKAAVARDAKSHAVGSRPGGLRRHAVALFCTLLGFYLLTTSGHFYATDEETLFSTTASLVERRSFSLPEGLWGVWEVKGNDNRTYAIYGPGHSAAAAPLYAIGKAVARFFPAEAYGYLTRFTTSQLNAFVTAATATLLYLLARSLGYRGGAALALTAIYGLATAAWPHGRSFFAEPLTALCLLASFAAIRRGTRPTHPGWLFLAGVVGAAALTAKVHGALVLPILGFYLLARVAGDTPQRPAAHIARALRAGIAWGLGLALVGVPFAWFNILRFGGIFETGYGGSLASNFSGDPLMGLYGLTLSTGKGLVWYAPPVILAVAGWRRFARRCRPEALTALAIVLVHLAFYSGIRFWHGDGAWGPRYLIIALPFALLPGLALLEGARSHPRRLAAIRALVVAGVAVQLLGVLVNFNWYLIRSNSQTRYFSPPASPILAQPRLLGERIAAWGTRLRQPNDAVRLADGFSFNEAPAEGAGLFPRWTNGEGTIVVAPAGPDPVVVKFTFFDHRPAELRTDRPVVLLNGAPLSPGALEARPIAANDEGWVYQFTIFQDAWRNGTATVTLRSATFNPRSLSRLDPRDEQLGVFVHNIEAWRFGQPLRIEEALPLDSHPIRLYWWFNNDLARRHLVDWWPWYTAMSGLPLGQTIGWIIGYGGVAVGLLATGLKLGLPLLPPGLVRLPRRAPRRTRRPARVLMLDQ
jgi:hypothetical protein